MNRDRQKCREQETEWRRSRSKQGGGREQERKPVNDGNVDKRRKKTTKRRKIWLIERVRFL